MRPGMRIRGITRERSSFRLGKGGVGNAAFNRAGEFSSSDAGKVLRGRGGKTTTRNENFAVEHAGGDFGCDGRRQPQPRKVFQRQCSQPIFRRPV